MAQGDRSWHGKLPIKPPRDFLDVKTMGLKTVEHKSTIKRKVHRFTWRMISIRFTPQHLHLSSHP